MGECVVGGGRGGGRAGHLWRAVGGVGGGGLSGGVPHLHEARACVAKYGVLVVLGAGGVQAPVASELEHVGVGGGGEGEVKDDSHTVGIVCKAKV